MLKLEKSSQLSGVTVRLRERERFFEPVLLKALAIALCIHLGGLVLFQVTPFSFTSTYVFPPVKVQASSPIRAVSTIVTPLEPEEELAPAISLIPPLEMIHTPHQSFLSPTIALNPHVFESLEEKIWPFWESQLSLDLEEPRIRLAISGDLALYSLAKTDPLLAQMQSINKQSSPEYVSYRVQMDEETGEIFWFERLQSSGKKEIDQETEKIVLNLRFNPDQAFGSVVGNLHFTVLKGSL